MSARDRSTRDRRGGALATSLARAPGWLAGAVLGAALMLVGLAQAGKLAPPKEPAALVALGQLLEGEDRRVELMLARGDAKGAIGALEATRRSAWPDRRRGGDASVQLRHDHYGRLARLRLDHPEIDPRTPQQLLELVDEGLGRDYEMLDPNPFTARLLGLRGEVLEQLGRDDEALLAYEEALDMNRALLDSLLAPGAGDGE